MTEHQATAVARRDDAGQAMPAAVRERPIVFGTEMVRAIIEGRKTQMRRIMRPQPPRIAGLYARGGRWYMPPGEPASLPFPRCPYGQPGDRLYVRETWALCGKCGPIYLADDYPSRSFGTCHPVHPRTRQPDYRWIPSIHMPRWASRITLEITDVRVERVQEISEADARAEGMIEQPYRRQYAALWDRWYAHRGYGWDANPWVWVLTFRRVNGPVRHDLDVRTAAGRTTRGAARDDAQV